jgi:hypothetical protein
MTKRRFKNRTFRLKHKRHRQSRGSTACLLTRKSCRAILHSRQRTKKLLVLPESKRVCNIAQTYFLGSGKMIEDQVVHSMKAKMTLAEKMIEDMQAPAPYLGACNEFDGPQRPPLAAPPLTDALPAVKNDRVEELGPFGALTGEVGTVLAADSEQAVVKWDDDGRELLRQQYLLKLGEGSA